MTRLKRWESPRQPGRNHKGKGGAARQRQRRKQQQLWRQRLKGTSPGTTSPQKRGPAPLFLFGPTG